MTWARRTTSGLVAALVLSGCAGQHPTGDHGPADHDASAAADGHHSDDAMDAMGSMGSMDMAPVSPPPADADWNAADATYLSMMVAHHSQAIDMAELAEDHASDPRVRRLAESIGAGQGREVVVMATWLVEHGQPEPTPDSVADMSDMGMPGMLTGAQVDDLAATRGAAFDRRFLEDMVQHHQGAVAMAEDVLGAGRDVRVAEMATDVVAGQSAEIRRMRDLLRDLP